MSTPAPTESSLTESKRPLAKARIISARVTETEYAAIEKEAWASGKTIGDWTRDCALRGLQQEPSAGLDRYLFTELVAIQLLLINTLGPLIRGERMTAEHLNAVLRQVQSTKARKAQELLNKRLNAEERSA
jgi:Mobilization protein NikA